MLIYSFDWSGAGKHTEGQKGIQCYKGDSGMTPNLAVPIRGSDWTRVTVLDQLQALAAEAARDSKYILAGLDFPFSFPWSAANNTFPGAAKTRVQFWQHVHQAVWPVQTAQALVDRHPNMFAKNGNGSVAPHQKILRRCESLCSGKSVFNLIGAGSPGKGAVCGIAVLQELTNRCIEQHLPLLIWPFFKLLNDGSEKPVEFENPMAQLPTGCLVVVETYPKWYWTLCGCKLADRFDTITWDKVRKYFANVARPAAPLIPMPRPDWSKDQADALIAWYGLSRPGNLQTILTPTPNLVAENAQYPDTIREEGWIDGV